MYVYTTTHTNTPRQSLINKFKHINIIETSNTYNNNIHNNKHTKTQHIQQTHHTKAMHNSKTKQNKQ